MKKVSIVIPTYNEEENINIVYKEVVRCFSTTLSNYDYEILFIDNYSTDSTRYLIRTLAKKDHHIKAIFNARNFGQARSHYYGLTQATGDCAVLLHADLQNPLSAVVQFIEKWQEGAKVVIGIYDNNLENVFLRFMRNVYYRIMKVICSTEQIEHFSDFLLVDKSFINVLQDLHDPAPYLRGIVAELGVKMEKVYYTKNVRSIGKTKTNFFSLYDFAMNGVTAYSKGLLRLATFLGTGLSFVSIILAFTTLIRKLLYWETFSAGIAAISVGFFFLISIVILLLGLIGEYILSINIRVMNRPLVIEEERIGFNENM